MEQAVTPKRSVLSNTEFRSLWLAEAQSVLGDQLAKVAITLAVFNRTHSALWSAVVFALTYLPALAGGLGLSGLADRYPRRTVMLSGLAGQAVMVALMAVPHTPLALMYVLLTFSGFAQAPALAAQNAMTRDVFTDDAEYFRSQDLRQATTNTMMLVGLAVAGLLVTAIGPSWALAIDAATFVVSIVLVRFGVKWRPAAGGEHQSWTAGIRVAATTPWLRTLLGISYLVGLAVVPEGLAAPLAEQLGAPGKAVGWLLAADPLGYVVGLALLSKFVSQEARQRWVGALATASVAILLVFGLKPSLIVALFLLAAAGAVGAYQVTVIATITSRVPNEIRGGVVGTFRTGL
ncbi:MAG: MFS transporter, partial [Sciscionella sp.]|nr:MFS transporter [Sciscionella sp.]